MKRNVFRLDGVGRSSYFGDEAVSREKAVGRKAKLKNRISADINKITSEIIKNEGENVINWISILCNELFMKSLVLKYLKKIVIVTL